MCFVSACVKLLPEITSSCVSSAIMVVEQELILPWGRGIDCLACPIFNVSVTLCAIVVQNGTTRVYLKPDAKQAAFKCLG